MNKIKHITRLLMCGVVSILLALSFNVKGVNELNSGQSNLTNKVYTELEFPNIIVEKETDWNNKLGVNLTTQQWQSATWDSIIGKINTKINGSSSIHISKGALDNLFLNPTALLPLQIDFLNPSISKNRFFVILDKIDANFAKVTVSYGYSYNNSIYNFIAIKTIDNEVGSIPKWIVSRPIDIFIRDQYDPYNNENIGYIPKNGDRLSITYTIDNLPLLNPVTQGITFDVTSEATVYESGSAPIFKVNFSYFHYGKDSSSDEYRIIYNGNADYQLIEEGNNRRIVNVVKSKLWIQIYKKSSTDLTYTMTHREETIGTENCYISAIRLLP